MMIPGAMMPDTKVVDKKEMRLQGKAGEMFNGVEVVRDEGPNGVIKNIAVITKGVATPAWDTAFEVDDTMLEQVMNGINEQGGVKSRITHPWEDGILYLIGNVKDARIDGDAVRGDLHFGSYASKVPGKGDVSGFLSDIANEDPQNAGTSIVFIPAPFEHTDEAEFPKGRVELMKAVDVVDTPGANPNGFLSKPKPDKKNIARMQTLAKGEGIMKSALRKYLESIGLKDDASDAEEKEFVDGLDEDKADIAGALVEEPAEDAPVSDPPADDDVDPQADEDIDGAAPELSGKKANTIRLEERKRSKEIRQIGKTVHMSDRDIEAAIDNPNMSPDAMRKNALNHLSTNRGAIEIGADRKRGATRDAVIDALMLRAGWELYETDPKKRHKRLKRDASGQLIIREPHGNVDIYLERSITELGQIALMQLGAAKAEDLRKHQIAECMLRRDSMRDHLGSVALTQAPGDFPNILRDAINKMLLTSYEEAEQTWNILGRRTTTPDFKTIYMSRLSEADSLAEIKPGGEIEYGTLTDTQEIFALLKYGGGVPLTFEALVNDDLDAFAAIPRGQGAAAARLEETLFYAIFNNNPDMSDSIALFHADHFNLDASGAAPSVAEMSVARAAMRRQTGLKGVATLNIVPKFALVPPDLETEMQQLLTSATDPAATASGVVNPFQNRLQMVATPYLTSTTAWYLLADYRAGFDTIVMSFLTGMEAPEIKNEVVFDTGDKKFAVVHIAAAKAADWRTMYKNPGA